MKNAEIEKFLLSKGFRQRPPDRFDADSVTANYHKVLYDKPELPFCLGNEKPPQMNIREWFHNYPNMHPDAPFYGYEIGIVNEAPAGWINFMFYSINDRELIKKFDEIEKALCRAWISLFERKTA